MPLVERIAAAPHLTPSEKVLARFYEDALPGAALLNLDEVCSATGLSTATVARFARTLGYSGFREMSRELHADLRTGIAHPVDRLRPGDGHGPSPLTTRFERARADLESSAASLDPQVFEHVADLLSDAGRPLYLGAVASGRPLLEHFAMLAEYLRGGITVLGGTDRWAHAMSGMSADAVVLATAFDRAPVSIKALLDFAGGRGATTILLTNRRRTPLAASAAIHLVTSNSPNGVFRSRTALLATLEALLDAMAERCPSARERAKDIELAFSLLHGYLEP